MYLYTSLDVYYVGNKNGNDKLAIFLDRSYVEGINFCGFIRFFLPYVSKALVETRK